jgi:hypothetical protein
LEKSALEEINIFSTISPFLPPPENSTFSVRDERELQLRLYCKYWGNHAEDALIYRVLQNLNAYGRSPNKIEIYGNKDPCFQCQVKLQWLADYLKTTIVYYSNDAYHGPCLHIDAPCMVVNYFSTRPQRESGKIKKFTFERDDPFLHPLEAFIAPIDTLREKDLLKPRMLMGDYEGTVLEVLKSAEGGVLLKIAIDRILSTSLLYQPGKIPIDSEIRLPENLTELCKLYNRKKNVYIYVPQELAGLPFSTKNCISFRLIDNRIDIKQSHEEELISKISGNKGFYPVSR